MPEKRAKMTSQDKPQRFKQTLDWIMQGFVLLVFVVHPLIVMPDTYISIVDVKRVFYAVVLIATCLAVLGLVAITETTVSGLARWPGFRNIWSHIRPYEYALLAYWLMAVISTLLSETPGMALLGYGVNNIGLLIQTAYLLTAVLVGRLYVPRERDLLLFCMTAAAVAVIAVFQYYGMDFLFPTELMQQPAPVGSGITFMSTMSNRNIFSTYLCLALCICMVLFSQCKKKLHWVYLPMAWIIFYALILGNSESGYVGLVAATAILFPWLASTAKRAARLFLFFAGCSALLWLIGKTFAALGWYYFLNVLTPFFLPLAAVLLCATAVLWVVKLPRIPAKIYRTVWCVLLILALVFGVAMLPKLAEITGLSTLDEAAQMLQGNFEDNFGSNRLYAWTRALGMAMERPLTGYGPNCFEWNFNNRYYEDSFSRYGVGYAEAHNEYIQYLFDTGFPGLLFMLAFYALILWYARKKLENATGLAVFFAMVVFLVQAFFNFSTPLAHPIVWTLWGVLAAIAAGNARQSAAVGDAK